MSILPWLKAFVLTLAIECPVVWLLLRRHERDAARLVTLVVFANLATHPLVWFVFPEVPMDPTASLAVSEVWAFAAEAVFFALVFDVSRLRATAASLAANAVSFAGGLVLYRWFGRWLLA